MTAPEHAAGAPRLPNAPRRGAAALLLAAAGAARAAGAQPPAGAVEARAGARVQVESPALRPGPVLTGRLERVGAESVWVRYRDDLLPAAIAREHVRAIAVSGGHPGRARRAWLGAGGGAAAAFALVALAGGGCPVTCDDGARGPTLFLTAVAVPVGAYTGAWLAARRTAERWVPARLPDAPR